MMPIIIPSFKITNYELKNIMAVIHISSLTTLRRMMCKHANNFCATERERLNTHSDFCVFLPGDL